MYYVDLTHILNQNLRVCSVFSIGFSFLAQIPLWINRGEKTQTNLLKYTKRIVLFLLKITAIAIFNTYL